MSKLTRIPAIQGDNLLTINTVSGITVDTGITFDDAGASSRVFAASAKDNVIWIAFKSNDDNTSHLGIVDRTTGEVTDVGQVFASGGVLDAIAWANGILYGARGGSATTSNLYTIDPNTAIPTSIGPIGFALTGLAYDSFDSIMYGATSNNSTLNNRSLITVNLSTGAGTLVGPFAIGADVPSDICASSTGNLFGWTATSGQPVSINKITGAAILLGSSGDFGGGIDFFALVEPLIPAPSIHTDDGYFVEHLTHGYAVFQQFVPENLQFTKRIRDVETIEYEISKSAIDTDGNLVVYRDVPTDEDFVKPSVHFYKLFYMDSGVRTDLMAGKISGTNAARGRDYVKIQGKDWLGYLDERSIPFDPNSSEATYAEDNFFGPLVDDTHPPVGYSYHVGGRDVARILRDILGFVFSKSYSVPSISWSLADLGYTMNYALALGDTTKLLQIIKSLSDFWPGFDFRVSTNREFKIWSPFRFGDPDSTADDGPTGDNIAYTIGDYYNHPPVDVEYTNTGPQATHLLGRGAGSGTTQNTLGKALGASDIQGGFGRIDGEADFGDEAKTQGIVNMRTRKEFIFQAQEVHEIEVTLDPQTISDFWSTIRPGFAVWIREDLTMHEIDSAQRILEMDCSVNNQGDASVKLGLNQIYNTSTHYGVDQA